MWKYQKEKYQIELPCNLTITYEYYNYNGYDSYVFYISSFVFGAHPDNRIISFTYDTINNKLITMADLIDKDPFLLNYQNSFLAPPIIFFIIYNILLTIYWLTVYYTL